MRHKERTINEAVRVFDAVAGIGLDKPFQPVKFGDDTLGQHEAARNILGDENWRALISGQVSVERVGDVLQLKDKPEASKVATLFNRHGFRIVPRGLKARTTMPNTAYHLVAPKDSVAFRMERLARIVRYLGGNDWFITPAEFEERVQAVIERIKTDETTANLLKGVWLPFAIPQMEVPDYGQVLDEKFLPAVEASSREQFPNRPFTNHRKGELAGQTTIVEGSRHEKLVEAMKAGVVVGGYFPNCLQGCSVDADREQMSSLPEQFLLAGGFEAASAIIAYPDVLARDGNTPLLDLAAMQWQSSESSLYFNSYDGSAAFGNMTDLSDADGTYAGGLVVLG